MHTMYTKGPAHYIFTIALFMVFIPIIYTILLAVVVILATLVLPLIYIWIAIKVVNVELKNDQKSLNSNHNNVDMIPERWPIELVYENVDDIENHVVEY